MGRGLSELGKRIIRAIANHTVNPYEAVDEKGDFWGDWMRDCSVAYSVIRSELYSGPPCTSPDGLVTDGDRRALNTHKVSFSRAVRGLIFKRGLVNGYALSWVFVDKKFPEGDGDPLWQGGGRKRRDDRWPDCRDRQARLRLLGLTEEGWQVEAEIRKGEAEPIRGATR